MKQLTILLVTLLAFSLSGCKDKDNDAVEELMQQIRNDYAENRDSACLAGIDTLRARYPKATEARREALKLFQDASLRLAQKKLAWTDSALEAEKVAYETMRRTVEEHHSNGTATAEELTALTRKRILRDSLQTQFDVLCAEIKYIHKRQKQE